MSRSTTRLDLLRRLKCCGPQTAAQLALALGVSAVAVRKHLDALAAEGALVVAPVRQPVGRPAYHYRVTEAAEAHFPHGHQALLLDVLAALDRTAPAVLDGALAACSAQAREHYAARLAGLPRAERVAELARLRDAEGFLTTVERDGDVLTLREHHCPIRDVAERYPAACRCEQQLFRDLLGADVEYAGSLLDGAPACTYRIPLPAAPPSTG
jgi:predicted ArsR family transcriptional regulator